MIDPDRGTRNPSNNWISVLFPEPLGPTIAKFSPCDSFNETSRSTTSGSGYSKLNTGPVETANYTDTTVTNDITYYYVVTAVDLANNESGYSNEDSAFPTDMAPAVPSGLVATENTGVLCPASRRTSRPVITASSCGLRVGRSPRCTMASS